MGGSYLTFQLNQLSWLGKKKEELNEEILLNLPAFPTLIDFEG